MKAARVTLIAVGLFTMATGAFYLLADVPANQYIGIVIWFVGALVIHDGVIAPVVFGISLLMRRAGKRMPFGVIAIVQSALVVAAVFTAIVVPAALKKNIGTANPTLLPLDYGHNLLVFYAVLVGATAVAIVAYLALRSRRGRAAGSAD